MTMTTLHERFEAIKAALHNAMNLADPEAALREAEEAFKASVVAEVTALHERLDALEAKLSQPPVVSASLSMPNVSELVPGAITYVPDAQAGNVSGASSMILSEMPSEPVESPRLSDTPASADPAI